MKKKEARDIAIDYLYKAAYSFYDISSQYIIDDKGTLSDGFTDEQCDIIQKELDYLIKIIMKKSLNNH